MDMTRKNKCLYTLCMHLARPLVCFFSSSFFLLFLDAGWHFFFSTLFLDHKHHLTTWNCYKITTLWYIPLIWSGVLGVSFCGLCCPNVIVSFSLWGHLAL